MPLPINVWEALRIRVQRLLRGSRTPHEDITEIFLALRDFAGGRACVVEIGNFIAHRGERNIGMVTREAREFFAIARFVWGKPGSSLSLFDLPANFSELLTGSFRRTDNSRLRTILRQKRQVTEKQLREVLSRIQKDVNGRLFLSWPTNEDIALINCLLDQVVVRSLFSTEQLNTELSATLVANGLLSKEEQRSFKHLEPLVGLFAVSQMHRCTIDLGDGTKAELRAGATRSEGKIFVHAAAELIGINPTGQVFLSVNFFSSNIDVFANATPDLHPPSDQKTDWPFPIHLTADGKLTRLS